MAFDARSLPQAPLGEVVYYWWNPNQTALDLALHVLYCVFIGMSVGLLCAAGLLFWNRSTRNIPTWIFFITSSTSLFILAFLYAEAIVIRFSFTGDVRYQITTVTCDVPLDYNALGAGAAFSMEPVSVVLQVLLVLVSDGAILFRAGVVSQCKRTRILLTLPWLLCLATGTFVMVSSWSFDFVVNMLLYQVTACEGSPLQRFLIACTYIFLCSSVVSNLAATTVFGSLLWKHRRFLNDELRLGSGRMTLAQRLLAAILESGVAYSILQIIYLGVTCYWKYDTSPSVDVHMALSRAIYTGISGMYPSVIFIIANIQTLWHGGSFGGFVNTLILSNQPH